MDRIRKTISRYNMLRPGDTVVVAISGGADSVFLLQALLEIGAPITGIAHVNHCLRGEESDGDEQFVHELAVSHGLPCHVLREPITEGNVEEQAREARYRFFRTLNCSRVATGHTRDDQAETVLYRFLRGSGIAGLAGVQPVREDRFIRPLLDITRAEIERSLRERNIVWREDSSNASLEFARNRIRHALLPQLREEWNPGLVGNLANLAEIAGTEEEYWRESIGALAVKIAAQRDGGWEIGAAALAAQPRAVARRLVRHFAVQPLGLGHVDEVLELAQSKRGEGQVTPPGVVVIRSFGTLRFERPGEASSPPAARIAGTGEKSWPGHGIIRWELDENATLKETEPILLRSWTAGDAYPPGLHRRRVSLADLFEKERVPSWQRRNWPIVEDRGGVLWAKRFGVREGAGARIWAEE